jgi:hypothetical protein
MSSFFDAETAESHPWHNVSVFLMIAYFVLRYVVLYTGAVLGWCLVGVYRFAVHRLRGPQQPLTGGGGP